MFDDLKKLRWGWIVIAVAYGVGLMPLDATSHLLWASLATGAAYLVLVAHTTHATAQIAHNAHESPVPLWRKAVAATCATPLLLVFPLYTLAQVAYTYIDGIYPCPKLLEAYCLTLGGSTRLWGQVVLGILIPMIIVLLDHLLLVALTLLVHKYLARSPVFVGRATVSLRVSLACLIVGLTSVGLSFYQTSSYWEFSGDVKTQRRVVETIYPAFEPLVSGGVFLVSNIYGRPARCLLWDSSVVKDCLYWDDAWPFIARQFAVMGLASSLYLLLTIGVLHRATLVQRDPRKKAKRGLVEQETEIALI